MSDNLPDNCKDCNPNYPWFEEDEPICPDCGALLTINNADKYVVDMECAECEYSMYNDDFNEDLTNEDLTNDL